MSEKAKSIASKKSSGQDERLQNVSKLKLLLNRPELGALGGAIWAACTCKPLPARRDLQWLGTRGTPGDSVSRVDSPVAHPVADPDCAGPG